MRRKKRRGGLWKGALVLIGAIGLTTLAINASDSFNIPGSSLLAGVGASKTQEHCPPDMVYVPESGGGFCIDRYETAAGGVCAHNDPMNQFETTKNLNNPLCVPVSKKGLRPWVNVPEHQALALCARVGKRLPSNREWYRAALGTPDAVSSEKGACVLDHIGQERADATGLHDQCVSSYGAYDMVGNVWEWIDASVGEGNYGGRTMPDEGYIGEADADGVPSNIATSSQPEFGGDYFFIDRAGIKGMFRGGFWGMTEKAGIFSINAASPMIFTGVAVGFRCVKEAQ
jgi:formylglycine-generating enzyme required for sulfatase activity